MARLVIAAPLPSAQPSAEQLLAAAYDQVGVTIAYDAGYRPIAYPGGDVPLERGVCSDVVIRALRAVGIDLQVLVHEDMAAHFSTYPPLWGLHGTDRNIDHRRVPNLETFFRRRQLTLPVSTDPADYRPGDIVTWRLPDGQAHIGIIADRMSAADSKRPLIIHNIGAGTQVEDGLFAWKLVGHFRWPWGKAKPNFPPTHVIAEETFSGEH